jgi:phosphoribosyl 1,2-cyclic phosphate phosphodiesterase
MERAMFYGTGAAEGIPDPFCTCYLCQYARDHGGKDVRTRSMFRVDPTMVIDMGADAYTQANRYGGLTRLQDVLITHTHEDHFCFMMMNVWNMATHRAVPCLNYYFVEKGYEIVEVMRDNPAFIKGNLQRMEQKGILRCHQLRFFETYSIGGKQVTPLKGHHLKYSVASGSTTGGIWTISAPTS